MSKTRDDRAYSRRLLVGSHMLDEDYGSPDDPFYPISPLDDGGGDNIGEFDDPRDEWDDGD